MNSVRFATLLKGQSTTAQKVFDSVPPGPPWTLAQICQDLARRGLTPSKDVVEACLNALADAKLIKKSSGKPEVYSRVEVIDKRKPRAVPVLLPAPEPEPVAAPEPQEVAMTEPTEAAMPIDIFSKLASRAMRVSADLQALAEDIESAALEVEAHMAKDAAGLKKLRQLQALLSDMG